MSSVPSSRRTVCCDVRWIQCRLQVNPLTPNICILHHASLCPPPFCVQRPTGIASLMPYFSLPLILPFLHPALSLSSHRSSDSSCISLSKKTEQKKTKQKNAGSQFRFVVMCVYRARIVKPVSYKYDSRGE